MADSNQVVPAKSLQERVGERIREQIGDLLTDEDLKKLVETAMHEAFFKDKVIPNPYGSDRVEKAYVVELMRGLLQSRFDAAIKAWLDENKELVTNHLDDAIAKGIVNMLQQWLEHRTFGAVQMLGDNIKQSLGIR